MDAVSCAVAMPQGVDRHRQEEAELLETAALLAARNRPGDAGRREDLLATALSTAHALDLPVIAERARTLTR